MKWMTSGANRLKANLNRSFGARRNKKSALIKNYESIVVPHFERKNQQTRNKNRTKRHISTSINAAPQEVVVVDKEDDNTTSKRKIRNGNPKQNRMIGVSSALPRSRGVSTFQHNFGVDVTSQHDDIPFNNMLMPNQQHDNTMPMTRQQQNDSLFNTDSIERLVNQQESQSAKKRQHQMREIVIRERAIQREMKEVALMKQQHMNLSNNHQQQQQLPMIINGGGGLDFNTHNSYQNTQKSSTFNVDLDMMNNTNNIGNGGGLDILRNDESGGGNGLSRFRMQPASGTNLDEEDDEASTSQAIQQEKEPNSNQLEGKMMPLNDSQPAQLQPPPIRYFNNGVEVNMQGSPLSSITSQSNLLNRSAVGSGIQVAGHVHHTQQQQGMEEEKMPSKKQPQQPGMPNAMPQQMMPQPQLMKQNTNYQMPNNQMTTTGMADDTPTIQEPFNSKKKQSTLPESSAKPQRKEDDMPTKAQRKAKKKAAKKEKRKRSSTHQQSISSKAQKIDKPKTERHCHHQEVVQKDEPNKLPSNTKSVKKTVNTTDAADRMPTKDELPSLTDKGCTSERSLSAKKKSNNLKADQKMTKSTDKRNTANQSSAASSSSNVNAEFIPKLSTHISRGPHRDVLDQLFGDL